LLYRYNGSDLWTNSSILNQTTDNWVSLEAERELLDILNDEKAKLYIPIIVFIAVLMLVGTVGNMMVLYVYNWKLKRRSANVFISAMAVFDLLGCVVAMPANIYDLLYPYTFYDVAGCKVFRFVESATVYGSAIILLEIAFDRYFKICKPLRVLDLSRVKLMCIVAGVLAIILSCPTLVVIGITRSVTPVNGTYGYDCAIDHRYKGGGFQKAYFYMLVLMFIVTFSCLAGFYIRIWIEIKHRRDTVISDDVNSPITPSFGKKRRFRHGTSTSDDEPVPLARAHSVKSSKPLTSFAESTNRIKLSRTTVIFLSVSIAFVVSYLPGIAINIYRAVVKNYKINISPVEEVMLKLFARFYFINNSINPLIYSYFNSNFRKQCNKVVSKFVF